MGLEQLNFDGQNRVEVSIATLQAWQPAERPYQLCFSGGKDSVVIEHLARVAGVKFDLVYSQTGIDPPELVYFIREHFPHVTIEKPKFSLFEGIVRRGMPRRKGRWCCQLLKESGGFVPKLMFRGYFWNNWQICSKSLFSPKSISLSQASILVLLFLTYTRILPYIVWSCQ